MKLSEIKSAIKAMKTVWVVLYRESHDHGWAIWENRSRGEGASYSLFAFEYQANNLLEDILESDFLVEDYEFEVREICASDIDTYIA